MRNVLKFELFASKEPSIFAEVLGGKNANEPHMVIGNLTNFLCIMLQGFFSKKKSWSWFYHVTHYFVTNKKCFKKKYHFLALAILLGNIIS